MFNAFRMPQLWMTSIASFDENIRTECRDQILALKKCHKERTVARFMGGCNQLDYELHQCLKQSSKDRYAKSMKKKQDEEEAKEEAFNSYTEEHQRQYLKGLQAVSMDDLDELKEWLAANKHLEDEIETRNEEEERQREEREEQAREYAEFREAMRMKKAGKSRSYEANTNR